MENVKHQHYVWRHYLSSWSDNEQIWTLRKLDNNSKIFKTNLMGVAQERYFYEQFEMDEIEEVYLEKFIDKLSDNPVIKNINKVFFQIFTSYNYYRRAMLINNPSIHKSAILEETLLYMKRNMLELLHTKIEHFGIKLSDCIQNKNYDFLNDEQSRFEIVFYLCIQFCRTDKMKRSYVESYKEVYPGCSKFWNIINLSISAILSHNILINPNLSFTFLENDTDINFITGDQPIFNVLDNILADKGEVIGLELYYPISPKLSLLLSFENEKNNLINVEKIPIDQVLHYNNLVSSHYHQFLFAKNKEELLSYQ